MSRTVLLASASVARFTLLTQAGIHPLVQVSHVDEEAIAAAMPGATTAELCTVLARAKGESVRDNLEHQSTRNLLLVAADSMLEFDGQSLGKPGDSTSAIQRWRSMRGRSGYLHTAHWIHDTVTNQTREALSGATVHFADVSDDEIAAYVATGEPLHVAGAFTHEGRSAAFISHMDGDPPAVGGISLHLLRTLCLTMGIEWTSLWSSP